MIEVPHTTRASGADRSSRRRANHDLCAWLIGGTALLLGLLFVVADLGFNQGELIAPMDDVYIHLQYGRQLGLGHFLQYDTGDPISTGASSLLYAVVLGAAYTIGFQGNLFLVFAMGFGVLCFTVSAVVAYRLGTLVVARSAGIWTGLLVAVSGPLLWGSASGMEVGLAMLLVTSTVLVFRREMLAGRFRYTPVLALLLALVRPEGLIFAAVLTFAAWYLLWAQRWATGQAGLWRRWSWTLLPLLAGGGQLLFYRLATGTVSANGVQAKSMLHDRPVFYLSDFIDRTVANIRAFTVSFLAFGDQDFAFPGALLLFFGGLVYLILARPACRPLTVAIGIGLAVVLVSVATLNTALVQNMRYEQPFLPLFLLFVVAGAYGATRAMPVEGRRFALHGGLAVAMVFSLVAVPTWAVRFGRDASSIRDSDVSVGAWITTNVPPGVSVAVKDVGAVAYFGRHPVVDLAGLGTDGLAEPANNGVGSLYEALRELPPRQRPGYFATYDTGPGPSLEQLRQVGVLDPEPVQIFTVQTPPDADGRLIVPFREIDVYRADWSLAGSGDGQPVPGQLRDYLNVGDLRSEQQHAYAPQLEQVGMQPVSIVARSSDVIDSGRPIAGGEAFTAHNLIPGRPLTITSRTAMTKIVPEMLVLVDGKPAGIWTRPNAAGPWSAYTFTVPGQLVTGSTARIEILPPRPLLNPYPVYNSFGYWLSQ